MIKPFVLFLIFANPLLVREFGEGWPAQVGLLVSGLIVALLLVETPEGFEASPLIRDRAAATIARSRSHLANSRVKNFKDSMKKLGGRAPVNQKEVLRGLEKEAKAAEAAAKAAEETVTATEYATKVMAAHLAAKSSIT
jgi:hypothetical protein